MTQGLWVEVLCRPRERNYEPKTTAEEPVGPFWALRTDLVGLAAFRNSRAPALKLYYSIMPRNNAVLLVRRSPSRQIT